MKWPDAGDGHCLTNKPFYGPPATDHGLLLYQPHSPKRQERGLSVFREDADSGNMRAEQVGDRLGRTVPQADPDHLRGRAEAHATMEKVGIFRYD